MRDQVFISYAEEDRSWLDRFLAHLDLAEKRGLIKAWSENEITPGDPRLEDIKGALGRARVGLLLVSGAFLKSNFIAEVELKSLLAARQAGELLLYWVPISASLVEFTELSALQAASDPARPLNSLSVPEQEAEIVKICKKILDEMGTLSLLTREDRASLRDRVDQRVGTTYDLLEEIGTGSSSIVYKARARSRSFNRTVAIKTLVSSELQPNAEQEFRERLRIASNLRSPTYVTIYEAFLDAAPYCVVMEYLESVTLDRYVEANQPCLRRIRDILHDLSAALAEAHEHGWVHEGLLPSNVHVDRLHRARLSAFRFLTLGPKAGAWGTFLIDHEMCSYLSPEQFKGQPRTARSDQYAVGLLGYELLSGRRIPPVTCPADFLGRPALYEALERADGWSKRAPGLGGIVARMLRADPDQRWSSMDEVSRLLEQVPVNDSLEAELRGKVLASYAGFQSSTRARKLFESVYRHLFKEAPEIQAFFPSSEELMQRQYDSLNRALKLLIDYAANKPDSRAAIAAVARDHRRFALGERHMQAFETALTNALRECGEDGSEPLDAWHVVLRSALRCFHEAMVEPDSTSSSTPDPSSKPANRLEARR